MKELYENFLREKRSQVVQGAAQINEVIRNHNVEIAKYLIHARDSVNNDDAFVDLLNDEIDNVLQYGEDKEIGEMSKQPLISLERLAAVATKECVISHWQSFIDDVLVALQKSSQIVREMYEKHLVANNAIAIEKKVLISQN